MATRFDDVLATMSPRTVSSCWNSGMTSVNQVVSSSVSAGRSASMARATSATSGSTAVGMARTVASPALMQEMRK